LTPSPEYVARKQEIVRLAADVFHHKGYDAGTLDDVAEALDMRRASLYYYIKSKSHLLYAIFEQALDLSLNRMDEIAAIEDPRAQVTELICHQVRTITADRTLFTVFFESRPRLEPEFEESIRRREKKYAAIFMKVAKRAIEAGVLQASSPEYVAQVLLGATIWPYKWFRSERHDADAYSATLLQLLLTPAKGGRKSEPAANGKPRRRA
jgi:AcrR family transcriptional regulator